MDLPRHRTAIQLSILPMTSRRPFVPLVAFTLLLPGMAPGLFAADPAPKPGYTVVLDIMRDEKGVAEDAKVVTSDDITVDHVLELIAMDDAKRMKPDPRTKDGHPIKYTARAPFVFPVEGDEGPESNFAPKPSLHGRSEVQPVYPADLAAKGVTGGVMLELIIDAEGGVRDVTVLRASNPEFAHSAVAAVKQWQFRAATKNGANVSSRWRLAVVFETDVDEPNWVWRVPPRPALGSYTVMHRTRPLPSEQPATPATPPPAPAPAK
jgi:TonB family protein